MAKPVISYKGYMSENPADRTGVKICIPQIVDRNQVLTLEQVAPDPAREARPEGGEEDRRRRRRADHRVQHVRCDEGRVGPAAHCLIV